MVFFGCLTAWNGGPFVVVNCCFRDVCHFKIGGIWWEIIIDGGWNKLLFIKCSGLWNYFHSSIFDGDGSHKVNLFLVFIDCLVFEPLENSRNSWNFCSSYDVYNRGVKLLNFYWDFSEITSKKVNYQGLNPLGVVILYHSKDIYFTSRKPCDSACRHPDGAYSPSPSDRCRCF